MKKARTISKIARSMMIIILRSACITTVLGADFDYKYDVMVAAGAGGFARSLCALLIMVLLIYCSCSSRAGR